MAARKKAVKTAKTTKKEDKTETKVSVSKPFYKKQSSLIIALIILAGLAYLTKSIFVAAIVDNEPIWRLSIVRNLEKRQGADVLDSLITEKLVKAEAEEQGVTVSDEQLQAKIQEIEETLTAQGQELDVLLTQEGLTRDELNKQISLQIMIEELLQKQISVSDEEIDTYIETYKDSFLQGVAEEDLRETAKTQLTQEQMSQLYTTWIEELKSKANIRYWVAY